MSEESTVRVGEYEILATLDRGGMGSVFKVRNVISDRIEAMKILLPDLAGRQELAERFRREIKILASLDHPNIAALRTALSWDNRLVMIMEYVEGITLEARLARGALSVQEALGYTQQVLSALAYAHGQHIIHRDIKPGNIMLTRRGSVKLMDFGIARCDEDQTLTSTGTTLGSLYYMSPEQVKGEAVDERSDVYSLGVTLYEMVTARKPFEADNHYSILAAHVQKQPKPPIALRPDLPTVLNDIIVRALAKAPVERFQSAKEFSGALGRVDTALPREDAYFGETFTGPEVTQDPATLETLSPHHPIHETATQSKPTLSSFDWKGVSPSRLDGLPTRETKTSPQGNDSSGIVSSRSQLPRENLGPVGIETVKGEPAQVLGNRVHRGLYISLGAAIVLLLFVAAASFFPRTNRTHAGTRAGPPEPSNTRSQPELEKSIASPSTQPETSTPPVPPLAAAPPKMDEGKKEGAHRSKENSSRPADGHSETRSISPALPSAPKAESGFPAVGTTPVSRQEASNSAPGRTEAQPTAANSPQLGQLTHDLDLLASRAAAINQSLKTLAEAQRSQGLGLRGDMVSSQERMQRYLARAESALNARDAEDAKKYLDLAEGEAATLETFLGR